MSTILPSDTIAAVATAPGRGGVGIVRVSGPQALALAKRLFQPSAPRFAGFQPRLMVHGFMLDEAGQRLDEGLAVYFKGPASFTGDDVAEFHLHGSPAILQAAVRALLAAGARLAQPGEFTKRALLSGRIDPTQAAAVAELVAAPTRSAAALALSRLSGGFGRRVSGLSDELKALRVDLTVAMDFPEDEVEIVSPGDLADAVRRVMDTLRGLARAADRAKPFREGSVAALVGRANAGKSSLLNAFLGRDRAIVTACPGTTRDLIEEAVDLDGLAVRLVDTAGLRPTADPVEMAGQALAKDVALAADAVVWVVDSSDPESRPGDPDDDPLAALLQTLDASRLLVAANKLDLAAPPDWLREQTRTLGAGLAALSAAHGQGLDDLAAALRSLLFQGQGEFDPSAGAPNAREAQAIAQAADELQGLLDDLQHGMPYDVLGVRLESACAYLATLTGELTPQEVLDQIFSEFCIGK